ncbi:hypothetical protein PybrP1_002280 [[Pythium] brassicae (nom. inval.)]|nr:hypothetical protein PybrP1_002280 [[Pythium] brassicae (nom. inval.)]
MHHHLGLLQRLRLWPTATGARALATATANVSHVKGTPHLKRKLGQHLLVSERVLAQTVAAAQIPALLRAKRPSAASQAATDPNANRNAAELAEEGEPVRILEIGPGTGNLTSALLNVSPRVHVHAVEFDSRMVERLRARFQDDQHRLTVEQKDFEDFEFASHQILSSSGTGEVADDDDEERAVADGGSETGRKRTSGRAARKLARLTKKTFEIEQQQRKVAAESARVHFDACVANIPYQLSSIIVSRLSNYMHRFPTHFKCAVLLVQEEFALRLLAKPGDQNYSRLSVNTALVADVSSVVQVSRTHFLPPPKVDSRVIKLEPTARSALPTTNDDALFFQRFDTMLRVCFLRKNKTLRALLLSNTSRSQLEPVVRDVDPTASSDDVTSDKDLVTERIEAALVECDLGSRRAVQLPVEDFVRLMQVLQEKGVVFRPSTTRHFRD